MNSGYDHAGNGLAERWVGIIKVRATALLADVRLPSEYWFCACRWVAYIPTHRVTETATDKGLPNFGDVVVVHQALKKPPSLENRGTTIQEFVWDTTAEFLEVFVLSPLLMELFVKSVQPRSLGQEKRSVNLGDITFIHKILPRQYAIEVQDIRELGMGWAWFVNDLLPQSVVLPAWPHGGICVVSTVAGGMLLPLPAEPFGPVRPTLLSPSAPFPPLLSCPFSSLRLRSYCGTKGIITLKRARHGLLCYH